MSWKVSFPALLLLVFLIGQRCQLRPVDIRSGYLKKNLSEEDYEHGRALIDSMQIVFGGKSNWLKHERAYFTQTADWYGRLKPSGWDTLPQQYELNAELRTDNAEIRLLNGSDTSTVWGHDQGRSYRLNSAGEREWLEHSPYQRKLIFKNYWFQFPFRIDEAEIIAYAGEEQIDGETYKLVFATWGSEKANREYDQFLIYLDHRYKLTYLHFTVRTEMPMVSMTARFDNYEIAGLGQFYLPFSMYVSQGKPGGNGIKLHENHYQKMYFF